MRMYRLGALNISVCLSLDYLWFGLCAAVADAGKRRSMMVARAPSPVTLHAVPKLSIAM